MANVRIKDLTTTAATTASDDFFGVDGATNGTRKLNAYSPTFGGNLTATGTIRFDGQLFCGNAGGIQIRSAAGDANLVDVSGGRNLTMGGAATFAGNLTVSGTGGVSTIRGAQSSQNAVLTLQNNGSGNDFSGLILDVSQIGPNANSRRWLISSNYQTYGNLDIQRSTTNSDAPTTLVASFTSTGNFLLGTTVDGGQKLQVNGTAAIAGNLTVTGDFITSSGYVFRSLGDAYLDSASTKSIFLRPAGTTALTLASNQTATFASTVTANGDIVTAVNYVFKSLGHAVLDSASAKDIFLRPTGTTALTLDSNYNIVPGTGALATTATNGFIYLQTCAGAPTGTPTTYTGRVASVYDTTNNKLYIYNGGWKSVTLA